MKRLMVVLTVVFLMFGLVKNTQASGFHISSIGGVETGGQMLSQWWNSSLQPAFRGEAQPGEDILVIIDDVSVSIVADSSGDWVYTPATALTAGDHSVSFVSNESTIAFTLTLGTDQVNWNAVGSGASETLPTVGFFLPTMLLSTVGGGLVILAKKFGKN